MRPHASAVAFAFAAIIAAPQLLAQSVPSKRFDVTSVKKSPPPNGPMMIVTGMREGDRWRATNSTLAAMVRQGFGADYPMAGQIVGGPPWIDTDRFDVVAVVPMGASPSDVQGMVRSLLADRFKLRVHTETRELPVYALVLARADGKLGPQLKVQSIDCEALREARANGQAPPMRRPTAAEPPADCFTGIGQFNRTTSIESGGMNMAGLASSLSQAAGRPVFDRTGLTGFFTIKLTFATEPGSVSPLGGPSQGVSVDPVDAPSLTAAVVDQLGLRLESRREQMPILVIDGAETPGEN